MSPSEIQRFTSWLGKRSYEVRVQRLGIERIRQIARENGKLGGRPPKKGKKAMSLYKRGDVWWYKFRFAGQMIRESTKSESRTVAKEAERARRRELEESFNRIAKPRTAQLFSVTAEDVATGQNGSPISTKRGHRTRKSKAHQSLLRKNAALRYHRRRHLALSSATSRTRCSGENHKP